MNDEANLHNCLLYLLTYLDLQARSITEVNDEANLHNCSLYLPTYLDLQARSITEVNDEAEWRARMPWLYYEVGPTAYEVADPRS